MKVLELTHTPDTVQVSSLLERSVLPAYKLLLCPSSSRRSCLLSLAVPGSVDAKETCFWSG